MGIKYPCRFITFNQAIHHVIEKPRLSNTWITNEKNVPLL